MTVKVFLFLTLIIFCGRNISQGQYCGIVGYAPGSYYSGAYSSGGYSDDHYRRSRVTGYDYQSKQDMVKDYFEARKLNRMYRNQERRPGMTQEEAIYYAKKAAPARLTLSELDTDGTLRWPRYLMIEEFEQYRDIIDEKFISRSINRYMPPDEQDDVKYAITNMMIIWKTMIREIPSYNYVRIKRFLESISYETRFSS
jgi:hypothetical protein